MSFATGMPPEHLRSLQLIDHFNAMRIEPPERPPGRSFTWRQAGIPFAAMIVKWLGLTRLVTVRNQVKNASNPTNISTTIS